jgi:hypothetical protein
MPKLEDLILQITVSQRSSKPEETKESSSYVAPSSETKLHSERLRTDDWTKSGQITVRNRRFVEVLSPSTYRLPDQHDDFRWIRVSL